MKTATYIKRGFCYCLGLFIMALGVSISKESSLGVSPVNSIPAVLSTIINIDMGVCTTAVLTIFILLQIVMLRKKFKLFNLLQIIPSFLFGFFVTGSTFVCEIFLPATENYFVRLIYILISMFLIALGILFYLNAEILSLPAEGVMQVLSVLAKIKVSTAKLIFDWSVVLIATALSLVFLHELNGIREGTIISALGVGIILKFLEKILEKPVRKFIYGKVEKLPQK